MYSSKAKIKLRNLKKTEKYAFSSYHTLVNKISSELKEKFIHEREHLFEVLHSKRDPIGEDPIMNTDPGGKINNFVTENVILKYLIVDRKKRS
jgi:hypothetical protein